MVRLIWQIIIVVIFIFCKLRYKEGNNNVKRRQVFLVLKCNNKKEEENGRIRGCKVDQGQKVDVCI